MSHAAALHPARPERALVRLTSALVWLTVAGAAVVVIEPAPFDLLAVLAMLSAMAAGLRMPRDLAPMVLLLVLFCAGGYAGLVMAEDFRKAFVWVSITTFLAAAGIFFAAYARETGPAGLRLVLGAYLLAALVVAALAALGYLGGIGALLLHGRAVATFKDPNVLGAFLVLPAACLVMRILERPALRAIWPALGYALLALGVLLTFSRGAWGLLLFATLATFYLALVTSRSGWPRTRIALIGIAGLGVLALALVAVLSIDSVSTLFQERAGLQSYDLRPLGRFDRYGLGFLLAMEHPLGIGPNEFGKFAPEDPHNVYLNGLLSYGWVGGLAYLGFVTLTLQRGFRLALHAGPALRVWAIPLFATFLGLALEGLIIDTDHWRHFYLVAGLLWGLQPAAALADGRRPARIR